MSDPADDDARRGFRVRPEAILLLFVAALLFFIAGMVEAQADSKLPIFHQARDSNVCASVSVWFAGLGIFLWAVSAPPGRRPRPATAKPRFPLCAHCFNPYIEGAHFCPTCGRPQTFFAATGGYETIYAEAWLLGKAANHPTSLWHVWTLTAYAASVGLSAVALLYGQSGLWILGFAEAYEGTTILAALLAGGLWTVHAYIWFSLAVRSWSRWNARLRGDDAPPESDYGDPPYWTHDLDWTVPVAPAYGDTDDYLTEPDPADDNDEP